MTCSKGPCWELNQRHFGYVVCVSTSRLSTPLNFSYKMYLHICHLFDPHSCRDVNFDLVRGSDCGRQSCAGDHQLIEAEGAAVA